MQTLMEQERLAGEYPDYSTFKHAVESVLNNHRGKRYVLICADIKSFCFVNEAFGMAAGDRLLYEVAASISSQIKPWEAFCRISGDSFVVFWMYRDRAELDQRFCSVAGSISRCAELTLRHFHPRLVGGACLIDAGPASDLENILNRAHIALKSAKRFQDGRLFLYEDENEAREVSRQRMETEFWESLEREELVLYLQPQVPIHTGLPQVFKAEVLVRWMRDGKLRAITGEFIDLFEQNGMIVDLDYYVFENVCRFIRENREAGRGPVCLSVNVSQTTMLQPDFTDHFCRVKAAYGIQRGEIVLEFTERTAVRNFKQFIGILEGLRQEGFICAMDDFGTGQSSLNVLQNLPLDVLKLDCMFFAGNENLKRRKIVVSSVLQMAKQLSMKTVAEGVEDLETAAFLRDMGCDYIQGHVYYRPGPIDDFEVMLKSYWPLIENENKVLRLNQYLDRSCNGYDRG